MLLAGPIVGITPAAAAAVVNSPAGQASSFQGGASHSGAVDVLPQALTPAWSAELGSDLWTPVSDGTRVFAVEPHGSGVNELVALSLSDGQVLWGPQPLTDMTSPPTYDNGQVFVALDDNLLQAWNAVDGSRTWTTALPGQANDFRQVVAANGVLLVSDFLSNISAVAESNGQLLWTHTLPGALMAAPTVAGGEVIAAGAFGEGIEAFDLTTGALRWTGSPFVCGYRSSIAASGGSIYLSNLCQDRQLDAATGAVLATAAGSGPLTATSSGLASIVNGHVSWQSTFGAAPSWTSAAGDYSSAVLSDGQAVIATTANGRVDSLSAATGELEGSASGAGLPAPTVGALPNGGTATMSATANTLLVPYGPTLRAFRDPNSQAPVAPVPPAPAAPVVLTTAPTPLLGTSWTTVGGNPTHDGDVPAEQTSGRYSPAWSRDYVSAAAVPGRGNTQNVSTPVIVPGGVFVVATDDAYNTALYGYQPLTGLPLWPPVSLGTCGTSWSSLTYSDGILVASGTGCDHTVAVAAATGTVLWTGSSLGNGEAAGGRLFVGPAVYQLATGAFLGKIGLQATDVPVVDGGAVYTTAACDRVEKWDTATLNNLWTYTSRPCTGPADIPALENGLLRYRDGSDEVDLNPITGALVDSLPAEVLPASSGTLVVLVDGNRLVAENATTRQIIWTYILAGQLAFRPTIAGTHVLALDLAGNLSVLDAATGQLLQTSTQPLPSVRPGYDNSLAAAQGLLVYPSRLGITVLRADDGITSLLPPAPPTPVLPPLPSPTPPPIPTPIPTDPISAHYALLGGAASTLGLPVGRQYAIAGGRGQNYQRGQIFYSARTGACDVVGAIDTRYRAIGGPKSSLGFPTTDETLTSDSVGRDSQFTGGAIYWSPATGAHVVTGPIRTKWLALGAEHGRLGYPTTDVTTIRGGQRSTFQHGAITYTLKKRTFTVTYH